MLGITKDTKGQASQNVGSSQGLPKSMVTNDVVLNLKNDALPQRVNSQIPMPTMSKKVSDNNSKKIDVSVSTAGLDDVRADDAKDSYIDGVPTEKFGDMNVSDDTRKETQI